MSRNERGRFGTLKSDSIHHFFRNACTKSGSLRFSQFSGCWLILSVYILRAIPENSVSWGQNAIDIKLSWWGVKLHLKFAGWGVNKEKECIGGRAFLYSYRQVCISKSRLVVFYQHFCIVRFFSFSYFPVSNYMARNFPELAKIVGPIN